MIPRPSLALLAAGFTAAAATGNAGSPDSFGPSLESARDNGPQIFNAIYNAMREFGSAVHHNGMSIFPGIVPEGVLLYHGTHTREVPQTLEWLAFEIEHAQGFTRPRPSHPRHPPGKDSPRGPPEFQTPLQDAHHPSELATTMRGGPDGPPHPPPDDEPSPPGYLHTYQATRPLKMLYIDGMSAGKTDMGTLDTQDLLLATNRSQTGWGERERAEDLCALAEEWQIDGFIRMEPGFEIIYCHFRDGLKLISARTQASQDDAGSLNDGNAARFQWASAAAQRYHSIGGSRVLLDYSSMVSAFFYPINLTNPDHERPELPRLTQATDAELATMRDRVAHNSLRLGPHARRPVDWQGVADMVVARYGDRLPYMAATESLHLFKQEVNNLLNVYIDYAEEDAGFAAARARCGEYYLLPVSPRTPEDQLIHAGIGSTLDTICGALFDVRKLVVEDPEADESSLVAGREVVKNLMAVLQWSKWKECGACKADEVCFIAMWPFGSAEDHFHPSCLNVSAMAGRQQNYWRMPGWGPPGHNETRPPPREGLVHQQQY
ncbi:hypothetical protein F4775DRAFT_249025 [Biscogniauxia sp. FL1348]|nr:hypothetical protein F4775DRAFT_249025 [Biscogniauxia sp. FL1348]